MAKEKEKEDEKIGLHIGCGPNIIDGWYNTDLFPESNEVTFLDASRPFNFKDETFRFIFSEHLFEHLSYYSGYKMLNECYRVLKPGGVIRITLNFLFNLFHGNDSEDNEEYINWWLNKFDRSGAKNDIKGSKACFVINGFYRLWGHKMIYDEDTLIEMLKNAGFKDVKIVPNNDSEYPELKNINRHGRIIGEKNNNMESTTFEGKK